MNRRELLVATTAVTLAGQRTHVSAANVGGSEEMTVAAIAAALTRGQLTSRALTQRYLDRIEATNRRGPQLGAVLETNPDALDIAASLDAELRSSGPRGPLHGVPILLKDNIETADRMVTSAGSLALDGWYAPKDAFLVARLRAAGAVVLGKANLSEWANFRSTHATSGWSARGGQTRNPYALNRTPSGSSSGSAVAVSANLCAIAVGTETNGSIVSPASINGVVGLKPTVGLVSRDGIVPLSHSQDTAGPLARTVRDAAVLLQVMAGLNPADSASTAAGRFEDDYQRYLNPDGLRGARLGIVRRFFADNAPLNRFLDGCVALLRNAGAIIVDPAELPHRDRLGSLEEIVLLNEFKSDLNAYLARRRGGSMKVLTLDDLIRFNELHAAREMPLFDQELLHQAQATKGLDDPIYLQARADCLAATRSGGIDAVLAEHKLDALVALTSGPAWLIDPINGDSDNGSCSSPAAIAGYPHISVPAGLYRGLPLGLSFFGTAFTEPTLLRLASGFEHIAQGRVAPKFLTTV